MTDGKIERVEEMPVFQMSYDLALRVEKATRNFPRDFLWIRGQSVRSSESVCANMTEGFYAQYSTEYVQSLYRCRREGRETTTHIKYSRDAGLLPPSSAQELLEDYDETLRQLGNLIGSIERKIAQRGKSKPGPGQVREDWSGYLSGQDFAQPHKSRSLINDKPSTIDHETNLHDGHEERQSRSEGTA